MTQISLATFTRSSRILVMAALAAALSGCQGLSEVRSMMPSFLGGGTPRPKPVELAPNPNLLGVRQAWTARIGPVNMPLAVSVNGSGSTDEPCPIGNLYLAKNSSTS